MDCFVPVVLQTVAWRSFSGSFEKSLGNRYGPELGPYVVPKNGPSGLGTSSTQSAMGATPEEKHIRRVKYNQWPTTRCKTALFFICSSCSLISCSLPYRQNVVQLFILGLQRRESRCCRYVVREATVGVRCSWSLPSEIRCAQNTLRMKENKS